MPQTAELAPLALIEDRSVEQLKADGDDVPEYDRPAPEPRDEDGAPMDMTPRLPEPDELSHLRPAAHVERVRALLEEEPGRADRRANAERWARTRGAKGKGASISG